MAEHLTVSVPSETTLKDRHSDLPCIFWRSLRLGKRWRVALPCDEREQMVRIIVHICKTFMVSQRNLNRRQVPTVRDSRLFPLVTSVNPWVSIATAVFWTCSSMYLCGIQVNVVEKWWLSFLKLHCYCQADIGYHDISVCCGHINPYSHNQGFFERKREHATHTPTNVNGKLHILVANTMGSGSNIA